MYKCNKSLQGLRKDERTVTPLGSSLKYYGGGNCLIKDRDTEARDAADFQKSS